MEGRDEGWFTRGCGERTRGIRRGCRMRVDRIPDLAILPLSHPPDKARFHQSRRPGGGFPEPACESESRAPNVHPPEWLE